MNETEAYVRALINEKFSETTAAALRNFLRCAQHARLLHERLGLKGALRLAGLPLLHALRKAPADGKPRYMWLTSREASVPLRCRVGSSDLAVFWQIFVEREYGCVDDLGSPEWMIDCGANVGYSAAWFLSQYPQLRVIAVEPDPENYRVARANLAAFGDRARVEQSAVWSRPVGLKVVRGEYRDGRDWAVTVREVQSDETPDLTAKDISSLLAQTGVDKVDLVKIDVEGAEEEIINHGSKDWVSQVDNVVIEIHERDFVPRVDEAFSAPTFARTTSGELTCYRRTGTC